MATPCMYPYITIDLVGVSEEVDRTHRGSLTIPTDSMYTPEGATEGQITSFPIPVQLNYQVSTWARQPRHDRQIIAQLFSYGRLPLRFGQLPSPQDGTNRRLDVLGSVRSGRHHGFGVHPLHPRLGVEVGKILRTEEGKGGKDCAQKTNTHFQCICNGEGTG